MNNLADAHICVQLFHSDHPTHVVTADHISSDKFDMAIFLRGTTWNIGDEITISFMPQDESAIPEWYSLDVVKNALTPAQMDIEYRARAAPTIQDAIKLIVTEMVQPAVPKLSLKFVDSGGVVRVRLLKGGGSSSLVGKACLTADSQDYTLTLGWLDVGTTIHEFSHALGMVHEHESPNGGIQWNKEAVYAWASATQGWDKQTTDDNILNTYATDEITGSVFDPDSVMLYFFPASLTLNGQGTKQNLRYSKTDLQFLASNYGSTFNPNLLLEGTQMSSLTSKPLFWTIAGIVVVVILLLIFLI